MFFILNFSYKGVGTDQTSNGIPFKVGDTISLTGFDLRLPFNGWIRMDGSYRVLDLGRLNPGGIALSVSGGATSQWGIGSINIAFNHPPGTLGAIITNRDAIPPYSSVHSSGGAAITNAQGYIVRGNEWSTDWWLHAYATPTFTGLSGGAEAPTIPVTPTVPTAPRPPTPQPPSPRLVVDGWPDGNGGNPAFDIDKFIATASFKAGTDARANARGARDFIALAVKAAKDSRLSPARTKVLLAAVNMAIANSKAKAMKRPLAKPRGRR